MQKKLGAVNAAVYDVNAACAGFVYALEQGKAFVESGLYKRALVIGSEHITWLLDWSCLLYTSPSPRDRSLSRMPSSA